MERTFIDMPTGKCFWAVVDKDGNLLDSRTAPDRKKAYAESALSMKLIDKRKRKSWKSM
jgi:hypothetical protein